MNAITSLLSYSFMQHAFYAAVMASIACGIIGSLIIVNRLVFMAGGIAHTAYGGVGLAFFLGWPVLPCTLGFTLASSCALGVLTRHDKHQSDVMIGVLWAAGMAFGIILLNLTPGYNVDLMSYLFGSILTVSTQDLMLMLGLVILILGSVSFYYRDLLALSFDEEFAKTRGTPVQPLYFLLLALVSLAVVMLIEIAGLILVIALLTIPPYLAQRRAQSLAGMMRSAVLWSLLCCVLGLLASYYFNLSSGAAIIAAAVMIFLLFLLAEKILARRLTERT